MTTLKLKNGWRPVSEAPNSNNPDMKRHTVLVWIEEASLVGFGYVYQYPDGKINVTIEGFLGFTAKYWQPVPGGPY
jgi:hypothetical protein